MMQDQAVSQGQAEPAHAPLPQVNETPAAQFRQTTHHYDTYFPDDQRAERLAKTLGWISVGIGLAQLLAPRGVSRAIGTGQHPALMRTLGIREIASGVGILSQRRPTNWLWTRVAGDAIDLALLGFAARSQTNRRNRVALATAAVAGVAVLDLLSSMQNSARRTTEQGRQAPHEVHLEKSITINRSPEECYRIWHDFENFPRFMKHLESVRILEENRMRWKAKAPAGMSVEWDAELIADQPGEFIEWRSLSNSEVDNSGIVRFERAPGGRGTIVRVSMRYSPPGGGAGLLIAKLFGEEPSQQIDEDLRRFKWLIETGEVPTTIGQPAGQRGTMTKLLFRKGAPG